MDCPLCLETSPTRIFQKIDPHFGPREYWKCPNCQLVFLPPDFHLTPTEEKARYDHHQNSPGDARYIQFLKRLSEPLSQRLKPNSSGLDFGCGPGPAMDKIFQKIGHTVKNYDSIYFPKTELLEREYDFVTCSEVVEHFRFPRKEFLRLQKLLKPQGSHLGVMTEILGAGENFSEWWYHKDQTHVCFYRHETFHWIGEWLRLKVEFPNKNVTIFSTIPKSSESGMSPVVHGLNEGAVT